jgi:hypothetical protein
MFRIRFVVVLSIVLSSISPLASQDKPEGLWDAVIVVGKAEIPFRFEITHTGDRWQGFFFEGDRKIGSTSASFTAGALPRL